MCWWLLSCNQRQKTLELAAVTLACVIIVLIKSNHWRSFCLLFSLKTHTHTQAASNTTVVPSAPTSIAAVTVRAAVVRRRWRLITTACAARRFVQSIAVKTKAAEYKIRSFVLLQYWIIRLNNYLILNLIINSVLDEAVSLKKYHFMCNRRTTLQSNSCTLALWDADFYSLTFHIAKGSFKFYSANIPPKIELIAKCMAC